MDPRDIWIVFIVFALDTANSVKKCRVKDGHCLCDVYITYPINECVKNGSDVRATDGDKIHDQAFLKEIKDMKEHASRLNELEKHISDAGYHDNEIVIASRLRQSKDSDSINRNGLPGSDNYQTTQKAPVTTDNHGLETENSVEVDTRKLIEELKSSCAKMKEKIQHKSAVFKTLDTEWNKKKRGLSSARSSLFKTMSKMVANDNNLATSTHEALILKNKVKNLNEQTEATLVEQNKTTEEKDKAENQYLLGVLSAKLTSSELNETREKFEKYDANVNDTTYRHEELIVRNKRFVYELRVRERELMSCYRAKTSTFCGFEDKELCGFTQENKTDFFDWDRAQGKTPSANTGPTGDNTCKSEHGHFMHIEASAKGKGNNAVLYSPRYRGLSQQCVEFFYHMYGKHVGVLNVYTKTPSDELLSVWRAFGNQGNFWIPARLQVPEELARASYQMAFEGRAQNGYQGDIAIDDIRVTDGPCPTEERIRAVPIVLTGLKGNLTNYDTIIRNRRKNRNRKQHRPRTPPAA